MLKTEYLLFTDEELAAAWKRTPESISSKRKKLGLKRGRYQVNWNIARFAREVRRMIFSFGVSDLDWYAYNVSKSGEKLVLELLRSLLKHLSTQIDEIFEYMDDGTQGQVFFDKDELIDYLRRAMELMGWSREWPW